jgi:hypothetical protein
MKPNQILLGIAFICLVVAGTMYLFAYSRAPYTHLNTQSATSTASTSTSTKLATASITDGAYTVYVHSIMSNSNETSITFTHVTYFEGTQASTTASRDVKCPNQPIQACVPTLTRGFYVRESGASDFSAPVPSNAVIVLRDVAHGTTKSLRNMVRDFQPVFDVVIQNGNVSSIVEKSSL